MKYENLETLRKAKGFTVEELIQKVSEENGMRTCDDSKLRNKYLPLAEWWKHCSS